MTKKNILITVLGSSPAVITETLYALHKKERFPQEMHIFTTAHGKEKMSDASVKAALKEFCYEYDRDVVLLKNIHVHVAKDTQGYELEDIRTDAEQVLMADTITDVIRRTVAHDNEQNVVIDASIAGGRKSMSFYMGYIFSMFARECDYLSHVLIDSKYEGTDFMYPTLKSKQVNNIFGPDKGKVKIVNGEPLDAKDAHDAIELAEIPFIKLNQSLTNADDTFVAGGELTYSECIEAYQLSMQAERIKLVIDTANCLVNINGWDIRLKPEHMALYSIMANDTVSGDFTLYRADWDKEQLNIERRWIMELAKMCNFTVSDTPIDDLEIISEKIGDKFDVCVSQKTINKILSDGITTSIFDRLCREIKAKLATKMVGNCLDLCSPNAVAVKMEDANGELPQYRKVTKSKTDKRAAAFGLLLNPAQIEIM